MLHVAYPGSRGGGALAPLEEAQLPPEVGPATTRAWGRLARLERLSLGGVEACGDAFCRGGSLREDEPQIIWFPAHVSMLTSLGDLEVTFAPFNRHPGFLPGLSADLILPTGLTRLDLYADLDWTFWRQPVYTVKGPAALALAALATDGAVGVLDLSGLELGALTSVVLNNSDRFTRLPAWLPRCTALRELRLHSDSPGGGAGPSGAAATLPPGALAGLVSLELLEARPGFAFELRVAGREALRPFTVAGSTARFPAATKRF